MNILYKYRKFYSLSIAGLKTFSKLNLTYECFFFLFFIPA